MEKFKFNQRALLVAIEMFGTNRALAKKINVSGQRITDWKVGRVVPSPTNCIKIEKATGGKVKREDLLADYRWDLLR